MGVRYPIVQAGMGAFTSAELVAAVSNSGGLGVLGGSGRSYNDFKSQLGNLKRLTNRPFGVNFLVTNLDEASLKYALDSKVPLVSAALGDPGALVRKAHDAGALFMHQVHTRRQARQARERGVDIIVAQGSEAGGYGQWVSSLPLIPQVVDEVKPTPVLAAGGIADGRGIAAALILGAQGVVLGTRFLASVEAPVGDEWKKMIIGSESEETVKTDFINELIPNGALGYGTVPRALKTSFIEKWAGDKEGVRRNAGSLRQEIMSAVARSRMSDYIPFTGETTGLIRDISPAVEIVARLVAEARTALDSAGRIGLPVPAPVP